MASRKTSSSVFGLGSIVRAGTEDGQGGRETAFFLKRVFKSRRDFEVTEDFEVFMMTSGNRKSKDDF
jgi:hypothetical protein